MTELNVGKSKVALATYLNNEILVDSNGEAWVSQAKLSEICGVAQQTINSAIARNSSYAVGWNLNENNQLDTKSAYDAVVYFATQGKPEAVKTLANIGKAGMKAYLYHLAGYTMNATSEAVRPKETEVLGYLDNATVVVKRELELHGLFGTPLHVAQIESVKTTESITGVDLSRFLLNAPAQQGIVDEDVMLEPKELAQKLGFKSAIALNKKLTEMGLQSRINGELVATDEAIGMFTKHSWKNHGKSGYNYKWKLSSIKQVLSL
jgi:hypothetical protein